MADTSSSQRSTSQQAAVQTPKSKEEVKKGILEHLNTVQKEAMQFESSVPTSRFVILVHQTIAALQDV